MSGVDRWAGCCGGDGCNNEVDEGRGSIRAGESSGYFRLRAAAVGLAALLWLLSVPSSATAISLDTLEGQVTQIGGLLTIDWTKVRNPTGAFDLSGIELVMVSDANGVGFDLVATGDAFGVGSGGLGDLLLEFTVRASAAVTQVSSILDAAVSGDQSAASVFEEIAEYQAAHVTAYVFESFMQNPGVAAVTPLMLLTITKNAIVTAGDTAGGGDDYARIAVLSQRFTVVPEPGTGLLLALGLAGLGVVRGRVLRGVARAA